MISISTMWNASKEPDGAALISQINDLGFDSVELSRDLTRNQIEQFKPHLIPVSYTHLTLPTKA